MDMNTPASRALFHVRQHGETRALLDRWGLRCGAFRPMPVGSYAQRNPRGALANIGSQQTGLTRPAHPFDRQASARYAPYGRCLGVKTARRKLGYPPEKTSRHRGCRRSTQPGPRASVVNPRWQVVNLLAWRKGGMRREVPRTRPSPLRRRRAAGAAPVTPHQAQAASFSLPRASDGTLAVVTTGARDG